MIDLIYIASPSFSGSTLLTMLLNAHPRIGTIGELKWGCIDIETYQCSCGALLRECAFWNDVKRRVEAKGLPFDLRLPPTDFRFPDHPFADRMARARNRGPVFEAVRSAAIMVTPVCRERWPTIAAVNREAIEAILDLQNASVFVDGSKDPVRLMHLIATGDYAPRVIQLVRDGRGVTASTIKNKNTDTHTAATDWQWTHEQIERVASRLPPDRCIRVHYEELCTQTIGVMRRVFEFAGLDPDEANTDFRRHEHHILGNSMRLRNDCEIRLDEKWRHEMDAEDLLEFEHVAGNLNRAYGYE